MELSFDAVPWVTAEQMAEVDRAMVDDFGIGLLQMMELAGRHLAAVARVRFLGGDPTAKAVLVLAGSGGNGGGGLVAARRLAGWGAGVTVALGVESDAFDGIPAHQLAIVEKVGFPVVAPGRLPRGSWDLIVDGLVGYGLRGAPQGWTARLIEFANAVAAPVLSLDVPSGVEATSGRVHQPSIAAAATLTLALPKTGLLEPSAATRAGELYLADIGVPPELYARSRLQLETGPIFARDDVVRLVPKQGCRPEIME